MENISDVKTRKFSIRPLATYFKAPNLFLLDSPTNDSMKGSAFNGTKHDTF